MNKKCEHAMAYYRSLEGDKAEAICLYGGCGHREIIDHDCWKNPVPYVGDGPLGHGYECGQCGMFLQAG